MKINFCKQAGGILFPADDMEAKRMERFKTGEMYELDIKLGRNPQFHSKVFKWFRFSFSYWCNEKGFNQYLKDEAQYEAFRKDLTKMAGYFDQVFDMESGEFRIEAKSLAYDKMEQEEFEQCFSAITQATMDKVFKGCDEEVEEEIRRFL
jgi:hypothetical protein